MKAFPDASKIGLISDTHGLLREEAVRALGGSDLILHAGDVGDPEILKSLQRIAPVVAIRGNIDIEPWADSLPATEVLTASGVLIYMLHDVKSLDLVPEAAGFGIILSGHSHQPKQELRRGVFYVNPGSAGPRRFQLPITVARLDLRLRPWCAEVIPLNGRAGQL
jgi:putative phosphoesterase